MTGATAVAGLWSEPHITVGIDGSPASAFALRWAARYAALGRIPLEVIMAWQPPEGWPSPPVEVGDIGLQSRLVLQQIVRQVLGQNPELDLRAETVPGPPAPVLLDASETASLLVLGHRGRGGFTGLQLGSVALHCTAHASCPVVVVRQSP